MSPRFAQLQRRLSLAWVAIALWLGGVELMPNMHLAMHAHLRAHVHDGNRTIYLHHHDDLFDEHADDLDAEVDEHGHVVPEPEHEHEDEAPELTHDERVLAMRLEHGGHSLAHHALALHPAAPPALAPMPFHRYLTEATRIAIIEPRSWSVPDAAARGPPSLLA